MLTERIVTRYLTAAKKSVDTKAMRALLIDKMDEARDLQSKTYAEGFKPLLEMRNWAQKAFDQVYATANETPKIDWAAGEKIAQEALSVMPVWQSHLKGVAALAKALSAVDKDQRVVSKPDVESTKESVEAIKVLVTRLKGDWDICKDIKKWNLKQKKTEDQTRERHDAIESLDELRKVTHDAWEAAYNIRPALVQGLTSEIDSALKFTYK